MQYDDQTLAAKLQDVIKKSPEFSGADLDIKVKKGAATLKGSLETKDQMDKLLKTVCRVKGVESLKNQLSVKNVGTMKAATTAATAKKPASKSASAPMKALPKSAAAAKKQPTKAKAVTKSKSATGNGKGKTSTARGTASKAKTTPQKTFSKEMR